LPHQRGVTVGGGHCRVGCRRTDTPYPKTSSLTPANVGSQPPHSLRSPKPSRSVMPGGHCECRVDRRRSRGSRRSVGECPVAS
jgi:hypothetical protein